VQSLRFKVKESNFNILISLPGLLLFEVWWFVAVFPHLTLDVGTPATYMAAFVLWAPLGVVSIASTRRRIQGLAWLVVVSVVTISWGLRSLNPS